MAALSPETGLNLTEAVQAKPEVVLQPVRLQNFLAGLEDIITPSENVQVRAGENLPVTGGASGGQAGATAGQAGMSPRDQAIAAIPVQAVMQKEIATHITEEVKKLRKEAKMVARVTRKGGAYQLNTLYARIHRLNALLSELFEAGLDVVKRLYIRIFIDKQPIL